jgi:metal-responsive CopG/Arc/MetJ family transcriptional regulator
MAQISVKIPEAIYKEMERNIAELQVSKNQFVNDALRDYNQRLKMTAYAQQMELDSLQTRNNLTKELLELDGFIGDQL